MKDSLCFVHRPNVMLPNRAIEVKDKAPGLWLERGTMQLLVVFAYLTGALPDGALQSQLRITFLGESLTAISPPFQYGIILTHGPSTGLRTGCLHTYVHDVAAVSPNLCLSSPEKRCGKTRNLPASLTSNGGDFQRVGSKAEDKG